MPRKRKHLSGKIRREVWLKHNKKCCICNIETSLFTDRRIYSQDYKPVAHVDHILPFSKGGECIQDNFRLLCSTCNMSIKNTQNDKSARGLLYV